MAPDTPSPNAAAITTMLNLRISMLLFSPDCRQGSGAGVSRRPSHADAGRRYPLVHALAVFGAAVDLAHRVLGQDLRCAVEHDASLGHSDDAVAIGTRSVERVKVAQDGDAIVPIDVTQSVHH